MSEGFVKTLADRLRSNGVEAAEFEARQIASAAFSDGEEDGVKRAEVMLEKRLGGVPLQYILGEWEFFGLPFKVGCGVLIPRPDTEIVAETALKLLKKIKAPLVADICAGSGCIGITLAKHGDAKVSFLEKSREAIGFLNENLILNGVDGTVIECDVLECPDFGTPDTLDLIVCNPPYIKSEIIPTLSREVLNEPEMALDGGKDGLVFYREIAKKAVSALKNGGHLVFEIGFDQAKDVEEILRLNGFTDIHTVKDYGGNDRAVYGTR